MYGSVYSVDICNEIRSNNNIQLRIVVRFVAYRSYTAVLCTLLAMSSSVSDGPRRAHMAHRRCFYLGVVIHMHPAKYHHTTAPASADFYDGTVLLYTTVIQHNQAKTGVQISSLSSRALSQGWALDTSSKSPCPHPRPYHDVEAPHKICIITRYAQYL